MKNKTLAISLAICMMACSLMACSDSNTDNKSSETSASVNETTEKEEEVVSTTASENQAEEDSTDMSDTYEGDNEGEGEVDVFDEFEDISTEDDDIYFICPPAIVTPDPETIRFYADNYAKIIAEHESTANCSGKSHKVTFIDVTYDSHPEMFVWCNEGNGDIFMVRMNDYASDYSVYNLFSTDGSIDMFTEGETVWIGGDCDGTCESIYSVIHTYEDVTDTDRTTTELVKRVDIEMTYDYGYIIDDVTAYNHNAATYHETLDENGEWQGSDYHYYKFYDDNGYTEEPLEMEKKFYYRPNPAQMVFANQGVVEVLPGDINAVDKLNDEFTVTHERSYETSMKSV